MVEHVMAALAGLQIDNCEVWVDAVEMPGCDGSSLPFVEALQVGRDRAASSRPLQAWSSQSPPVWATTKTGSKPVPQPIPGCPCSTDWTTARITRLAARPCG